MSTKPITWFKADKNQPRTHFNERELESLAQTIKKEGLIHCIEVDPSGTVIVGERRLRAMKSLGWKELSEGKHFVVNEKKLTPYERLRRQIVENVQHSSISGGATMDDLDTAEAYQDMLDFLAADTRAQKTHNDKGIAYLSREIGVPESTIGDFLALLEESVPVKKALRRGDITKTDIIKINPISDPEVRKTLKSRLLKGEYSGKNGKASKKDLHEIVSSIKREPMNADLHLQRRFDEGVKKANKIRNLALNLHAELKATPLKDIQTQAEHLLAKRAVALVEQMAGTWLRGKDLDVIDVAAL